MTASFCNLSTRNCAQRLAVLRRCAARDDERALRGVTELRGRS